MQIFFTLLVFQLPKMRPGHPDLRRRCPILYIYISRSMLGCISVPIVYWGRIVVHENCYQKMQFSERDMIVLSRPLFWYEGMNPILLQCILFCSAYVVGSCITWLHSTVAQNSEPKLFSVFFVFWARCFELTLLYRPITLPVYLR